ncbi:ribosomal protein S8 [Wilcoxina mikolae CBS 423.85]|nr:ribosomal protein S8 [Wilcoxina mikolae CBS 423.85]
MSLVNLAHVCSHLQNATKGKLGMTSVPHTKLILSIMLGLQDQGFISSVTRGSINGPDKEFVPTTQENIATRRLWLGLKYFDNEPVLSKMSLVSKPTQRIWMGIEGLEKIVQGRSHEYVEGLQPGEALFLGTDKGVLEAREAIKRRIGGQLLCRAS